MITTSPNRKYSAWHLALISVLVIFSLVWSVLNWNRIASMQHRVEDLAIYGIYIGIFEAAFIVGIVCMSVAVGLELPRYHPLHWIKHLRALRRDVKKIAQHSLKSRLFGVGFWLNFIGAIGTTVVIMVAIARQLPIESWGVILILLVDLVATFSWRIPLQIMRRKAS